MQLKQTTTLLLALVCAPLAHAATQVSDDQVTLCTGPAVVDALANDTSNTGFPLSVSIVSDTCVGAINTLGLGLFDISTALGTSQQCEFVYEVSGGVSQQTAVVTLSRESGCTTTTTPLPLLKVHPTNPRYLADQDNNVVYLAGGHVWQNLQDYGQGNPPPTNCGDHECGDQEWAYLRSRGYNFTRGWYWGQEKGFGYTGPGHTPESWFVSPLPFVKNGSMYNLMQYNDAYFDRLRERVERAAAQELYISVMLFEGFSVRNAPQGESSWANHPFHPGNNSTLNGYDPDAPANGGDGDGDGEEIHTLRGNGSVANVQRAYITRVIAELNEFDNVIWEICNECGDSTPPQTGQDLSETMAWMEDMAAHIRATEGPDGPTDTNGDPLYPNEHLILFSAPYGGNTGQNNALKTSTADIVALRGYQYSTRYHVDPPANDGLSGKPVLLDSDHIYNPYCVYIDLPEPSADLQAWCDQDWPWKSFTRGYNPLFMDTLRTEPPFGSGHPIGRPQSTDAVTRTRLAIGQTVDFALNLVNDLSELTPMTPSGNPNDDVSSTGYALVNEGEEYLVYQPDFGTFTVEVPAGVYDVLWFSVDADGGVGGMISSATQEFPGGSQTFDPDDDNMVLHLRLAEDPGPDAPPTITGHPLSASAWETTAVTLTVAYETGDNAPESFQWFENGQPITGATSESLVISPLNLGDAGNYTVALTNAAGTTMSDTAVVDVIPQPVVDPVQQTVYEGTPASFSAVLPAQAGSGPFEYLWFKDGTALPLETGSTISHQSVLLTYEGAYTVQVVHAEFGTVMSTAGFLEVLEAGIQVGNDGPFVFNEWRPKYYVPVATILSNDIPTDPSHVVSLLETSPQATAPAGASASWNGYDAIVFTPPQGFPGGTATFTYRATVHGTDIISNPATVTLSLPAAHTGPLVANPDIRNYSSYNANFYVILHNHLLANDEPGHPQAHIDFPEDVSNPDTGVLENDPGGPSAMRFLPPEDFAGGQVRFQYRTTVGAEKSNWTEVTLNLPAPPAEANNDAIPGTSHATPLAVQYSSLLANDNGGPAPVVDIPSISQPANGQIVADTDHLVYTPDAGFSGSDTFTYSLRNHVGVLSNPATVTLNVTPVAVEDGPVRAECKRPTSIQASKLLANDGGTGLTILSIDEQPSHGTIDASDPAELVYQPIGGGPFVGADSFTYIALDAANQATLPVEVTLKVDCWGKKMVLLMQILED